MENLLDTYTQVSECCYKGERYSARDNGAVLRHSLIDSKPRPTDNKWTFGKLNNKTGYLEIASVRVHRIIATAFHGEPETKELVIDHIDTNKQNNRPENLRWITRLENILLNPITCKRIELVCGSVEAFLENPSKFRDKFQEPNYSWMCTVSKEEAQTCLERLTSWAKSDKKYSGGTLASWIFTRAIKTYEQNVPKYEESDEIQSLTPNAVQRNWRTPSEFPCCPQTIIENPIETYAKQLKSNKLFATNQLFSSKVYDFAVINNKQAICVLTESTDGEKAIKRWALSKITIENDKYVHESVQTFFSKEGADKQFTLAQGLEWTGDDSIDDYC